MDELINIVVQKTGLSPEDARKAVEAVVNALKSKLPGPIASHLDGLVAGGVSGEASMLAGEAEAAVMGKLGGMFGGSAKV